jgi:DNA primase
MRRARAAPQDAVRRDGPCREILRRYAGVAQRRQGGRGYLADRGISPATQLQFRIGYAEAAQLRSRNISARQGIPVEDMVEAGLVVAGDDIPVPYDRFRDRVMFPISDWRGRVIAFGGRALDKDVSGQISQFAGNAAVSQGRHALQYRSRAARHP